MSFKTIISFIQNTFETNKGIPLHAPVFKGNERDYVLQTIDSTFVSSVGAFVDKAELLMAEISQTNKAVAVVNGTSGLHMALKLVGVNTGDEVITQALTFVATANAIKYCAAEPVFIDVDLDTMGLSPTAVLRFLESYGDRRETGTYNRKTGKRIAAILPMHTFGFPVRLDELMKIAKDWNIPLVEDAAESLGSYYKNRHTGSFGSIGVFSFNGNKIVTSGGGGMIVTQDLKLGELAKHLTTTAKVPHNYEYVHDHVGYNYRMPNLNAALLCAQLEQLDLFLKDKRDLAETYASFFENERISFRREMEDTKANYWLMCLELENLEERNAFLEETNASGVMTRPIWQLMFRLPMFENCYRDDQTNAVFLEERIVNIPSNVRI
jgi:aminotransferase in exopolysaccharide biosynthesis